MKFRVLETIKLKTQEGEIELNPGQAVLLPHGVAVQLLNAGRITPIEKAIYKVYSKILDGCLWLVADEAELRDLVAEGVQDPIYNHDDISKLTNNNISKAALKKIHNIKEVFPGATIENIEDKKL